MQVGVGVEGEDADMGLMGTGSKRREQQCQVVRTRTILLLRQVASHQQRTRQRAGDEQLQCFLNKERLAAMSQRMTSKLGIALVSGTEKELAVKMTI
jgi:adenylate kinase